MSVLTDLFTIDGIDLNGLAKSKAEAFEIASRLFSKKLDIPTETVLGFLDAREALGSTGLGAGVAIPHGRIKGLKQPLPHSFVLVSLLSSMLPTGKQCL